MHLAHPRSVGSVPPGTGHPDRGASLAEYSLALTGVATLVLIAIFGLGDRLTALFDCLSQQLGGAVACSSDTPGTPGTPGNLGNPGEAEPAPGPTGQPNLPPVTEPPSTTTTTDPSTTTSTTSATTTTSAAGISPASGPTG